MVLRGRAGVCGPDKSNYSIGDTGVVGVMEEGLWRLQGSRSVTRMEYVYRWRWGRVAMGDDRGCRGT